MSKLKTRKICGVLTNDHTGFLEWGYKLYVDDRQVVSRGGYFSSAFMAKRALRKAVRKYPFKPYSYCKLQGGSHDNQ